MTGIIGLQEVHAATCCSFCSQVFEAGWGGGKQKLILIFPHKHARVFVSNLTIRNNFLEINCDTCVWVECKHQRVVNENILQKCDLSCELLPSFPKGREAQL